MSWKRVTPSPDGRYLEIPAETKTESTLAGAAALCFLVAILIQILLPELEFVLLPALVAGIIFLGLRLLLREYYVVDTTRKMILLRRHFTFWSSVGDLLPFEELAGIVVERRTEREYRTRRRLGERHEVILLTRKNERIPILGSVFRGPMEARADARRLAPLLGLKLEEGAIDKKAVMASDLAGNFRLTWR